MKFTNTILPWFEKDLKSIAPFLRVTDWGLWAWPVGGLGRPIHWRLPAPHHPLEVIATMRGWSRLEVGDYAADHAGILLAASKRHEKDWVKSTDEIGTVLFVPGATVRLIWHLLTPVVPAQPALVLDDVTRRLWSAAGHEWRKTVPRPGTYPRPDFWSQELAGAEL